MNKLPDIWWVKITNKNYEILNLWWKKNYQSELKYTSGITGIYRNSSGLNVCGKTSGNTKGGGFDFGNEITFEQFLHFELGQNKNYELW